MCLLGDEVLRALLLPDGETGNAGSGSGNRVELIAVCEHIAEVQRIGTGEIVIETDAELVGILSNRLRRGEEILTAVRKREEAEETGGERIDVGELIAGVGFVEKDIKELVVRIVAKASRETFRAGS